MKKGDRIKREVPEDELSPGTITYHVSKIRERGADVDVAVARGMLRLFCKRARKLRFPSSQFPEVYVELLVSAFERYLSGEGPDIAKSLGLKRRGRPISPEIRQRNMLIAARVATLSNEGRPLTDNAKGDGVFVGVACRFGLSESEVRDIYYELKESEELQLLLRINLLLNEDSA